MSSRLTDVAESQRKNVERSWSDMKATGIIGIILVAFGFCALAYFSSPVRFLMQAYVPHPINLKVPIAGGLSLASGLALLFFSRTRKL
jgi:hypothetical protein